MIVRPIVVAALLISLKLCGAQDMPVNKDLAHGNGMVPDDHPTKSYKPTEVQSLRLQVKHKDAELALMQMQAAQQRYQAAMSELVAEGEKVKTEQKWPADTQFNPNDMSFNAPAPKKDEVKK